MLDVSGTYVRRITPDLMRNQPDAVRKVADKRGRPRWEWSSELVKALKSKRNKRAKSTNLTATSSATKEAQIDQPSHDAILPTQSQPEPQLNATIQVDLTVETHRKAIQGINQRNYIESQRLQEQNNPTIVLPKES